MNKKDLHTVVKRLLKGRGISKASEIKDFFSTDLNDIPDLTDMLDMDKASKRIIHAIQNKEKIGIYGDYDVDGTTSCAVFYQFFKMLGVEVDLCQPSRFKEGYGIHPPAIDKALDKEIKLLITVDCGITNNETADYALNRDIDLIITDHHADIRETLPNAYAVINPSRRDEDKTSERKALAGVGVAFSVCLAVKKELESQGEIIPSIYTLLQYVAIGTIADLAPLNNMNRRLVAHGLKQVPNTKYEGIKAFLTEGERQLETIPSEKVGFGIGPYLNSKGRLDHPDLALRQLISTDEIDAKEKFVLLEQCNDERKQIQKEVFESAKSQILDEIKENNVINIVYAPKWHEGVIGIVASKLVDTFKKPAIVFTDSEEEGIIKASARSAGDLNLFEYLKECSDLCTKFGGHKSAAGMSMRKNNLQKFKTKMNQLISKLPEEDRTVGTPYDLEVSIEELNIDLVKQLNHLEPFGMGNAKPIFKLSNVNLVDYKQMGSDGVHIKWYFKNEDKTSKKIEGVSFNHMTNYNVLLPEDIWDEQYNFSSLHSELERKESNLKMLISKKSKEEKIKESIKSLRRQIKDIKNELSEERSLSIYFELSINHFRGHENLQLMVRDLKWEE